MTSDQKYWFAAKRYGWGWGLPLRWEGWVVCAIFVILLVAGAFVFPPGVATGAFAGYSVVLTVLLVAICWLKGEPARWRSGGD